MKKKIEQDFISSSKVYWIIGSWALLTIDAFLNAGHSMSNQINFGNFVSIFSVER